MNLNYKLRKFLKININLNSKIFQNTQKIYYCFSKYSAADIYILKFIKTKNSISKLFSSSLDTPPIFAKRRLFNVKSLNYLVAIRKDVKIILDKMFKNNFFYLPMNILQSYRKLCYCNKPLD